jgi:hypothetical protein
MEFHLSPLESRVAVAVTCEQFENPGRGMSTVGSRYQTTGEGQQTEKTQCVQQCSVKCENSQ